MVYDLLCKIASKHLPFLCSILEKASLFYFPYIPHNVLPKCFDGDVDFIQESFCLPFPIIAIEDKAGLVILMDTIKDQIGLGKKRHYIEVVPGLYNSENYRDDNLENIPHFLNSTVTSENKFAADLIQKYGKEARSMLNITMGTIDCIELQENKVLLSCEGNAASIIVASKNRILNESSVNDLKEIDPEYPQIVTDSALKNCLTAFQEIIITNTPTNFILEETPLDVKIDKKRLKDKHFIRRSHERPLYTILSPQDIRKKLNLETPKGTHNSPIPHERRSHTRKLRSERFVNKQGKTVVVRSTWIGDSEKIIGNKRYKVLLDK